MINRILSKLILYTLIVFFILPFYYLYAGEDNYHYIIDFFHDNLNNTLSHLDPNYYDYVSNKEKDKEIKEENNDEGIFKREDWCVFWKVENEVCLSAQNCTPIGFNIHSFSDKPKERGVHGKKCYNNMKAVEGKKQGQPLKDGYLNLHTSIKWLEVRTTIEEKICYKCHTEKPQVWGLCYRFYIPDIEENPNQQKQN